jgi:hypothetical protein
MKIALKRWTKQSDDRLLNLLASEAPPPEPRFNFRNLKRYSMTLPLIDDILSDTNINLKH